MIAESHHYKRRKISELAIATLKKGTVSNLNTPQLRAVHNTEMNMLLTRAIENPRSIAVIIYHDSLQVVHALDCKILTAEAVIANHQQFEMWEHREKGL